MSLGRILVVEDEPGLLRVMVRYLTRLGYEAVAAACARDALDAFSADPAGFVAVLADLTLPDMPGDELVGRLRKANPSLAVLLASGSPAALAEISAVFGAPTASIEKPFTPKMLVDALGQLLESARPPQPD
jgi:DNA-binding NtrC family response regulator